MDTLKVGLACTIFYVLTALPTIGQTSNAGAFREFFDFHLRATSRHLSPGSSLSGSQSPENAWDFRLDYGIAARVERYSGHEETLSAVFWGRTGQDLASISNFMQRVPEAMMNVVVVVPQSLPDGRALPSNHAQAVINSLILRYVTVNQIAPSRVRLFRTGSGIDGVCLVPSDRWLHGDPTVSAHIWVRISMDNKGFEAMDACGHVQDQDIPGFGLR